MEGIALILRVHEGIFSVMPNGERRGTITINASGDGLLKVLGTAFSTAVGIGATVGGGILRTPQLAL